MDRLLEILFDAFLCRSDDSLGLLSSFRFCFSGELLLDLEGNRIGVHLVRLGCGAEKLASVRLLAGRKQDNGFDDQLADNPLLGLAERHR